MTHLDNVTSVVSVIGLSLAANRVVRKGRTLSMTRSPTPILIVSGLPRSGTSMMMRMIVAAGVSPLTDSARAPDEDNPLGYFELEAVKKTRENAAWLADAPGKAVKVVHVLLKDLPPSYSYRVVMMH